MTSLGAGTGRLLCAAIRDWSVLSDDDVIHEAGRVGSEVLGAVHWAMVDRDTAGTPELRSSSSDVVAALQAGALGIADSPVVRCMEESTGVSVEFHPSNGWFDPHGAASLNSGIHHEVAIPLGDQGGTFGAFVWSRAHELPVDDEAIEAVEVLGAAVGVRLGLGRSLAAATRLVAQLDSALASRTTIEQAKGLLAGLHGTDLDSAFDDLRGVARRSGRRLQDVAAEVLSRPGSVPRLGAVSQPGTIARRTGRSQPG